MNRELFVLSEKSIGASMSSGWPQQDFCGEASAGESGVSIFKFVHRCKEKQKIKLT